MTNYLIQAKLNKITLQEHSQTADSFSLDDTIEYLSEKLAGEADTLEVYSYESLLDESSIKLFKEIPLICLDN